MRTLAVGLVACASIAAVVGAAPAPADVIFSNLGSGALSNSWAWIVCTSCDFKDSNGLPHNNVQENYAVAFTPVGSDQSLDKLELALEGPGDFKLEVTADAGGSPGAVIEPLQFSLGSGPSSLVAEQSVLHPLLRAGAQYWLTLGASAISPSTLPVWVMNSTGDTGLHAYQGGSCSVSRSFCGDDSDCPSGETCEADPQRPWFASKSNSAFPRGAFRVTGVPRPAPVCGDGVTEGSEECDDGNTVDGDSCGATCRLPCGATVAKAKLTIGKLNTPPGDDSLSFSGETTLPAGSAGINPLTNGVRLLIHDAVGGLLDLTVPGGSVSPEFRGWKVNKSGTTWTWVNRFGSAPGGVNKIAIEDKSSTTPRRVKLSVQGKGASFAASVANLPLTGLIVLDPMTGQCATANFPGPKPAPRCILNKSGSTLTCK